jgi:hypothetical protein
MTDTAQQAQMLEVGRAQAVTTLAAAIITASGRPWSVQQALDLKRDVYFAMYPSTGAGVYIDWAKTRDERLNKVHGPTD